MVSYPVKTQDDGLPERVLILIVMDNGLLHFRDERLFGGGTPVLILIVMDNGLLP